MSADVTTFELDHKLTFGKHKNKTIKEVLCLYGGIGYINWCLENIDWFDVSEEVYEKLEAIAPTKTKGAPPEPEDTPMFDKARYQPPLFDDFDDGIPF